MEAAYKTEQFYGGIVVTLIYIFSYGMLDGNKR